MTSKVNINLFQPAGLQGEIGYGDQGRYLFTLDAIYEGLEDFPLF